MLDLLYLLLLLTVRAVKKKKIPFNSSLLSLLRIFSSSLFLVFFQQHNMFIVNCVSNTWYLREKNLNSALFASFFFFTVMPAPTYSSSHYITVENNKFPFTLVPEWYKGLRGNHVLWISSSELKHTSWSYLTCKNQLPKSYR